MEVDQSIKMVLVVRKDLKNTHGHKVRTGKLLSHAGHAAESWLLNKMVFSDNSDGTFDAVIKGIPNNIKSWIQKGRKKVALSIKGEDELTEKYQQAIDNGLMAHIITDAGLTEFGGVPTKTAVAIGPASSELIDEITGDLSTF